MRKQEEGFFYVYLTERMKMIPSDRQTKLRVGISNGNEVQSRRGLCKHSTSIRGATINLYGNTDVRPTKMNISQLVELSWSRPVVIGHRGSPSTHAENTMGSFVEAYRAGAAMVECDVHVSADGDVVILHDEMLDRTTTLRGPVSDISTRELVSANVPLLSDLLGLGEPVVVEFKGGQDVVRLTIREIQRHSAEGRTVLFGFHRPHLLEARELSETQFLALLLGGPEGDTNSLLRGLVDDRIDALALHHSSITADLARECREAKVPLFAWTVPPGEEVTRLHEVGVNFIITDHPQFVTRQLED